uniref:Abnormal spindle-like microcephaly-associated protein ASH domain-containing protein n=1 Tax=Solibacter usitatus (strain Ellin6076) TaxID=234267 RepID=Q029I0_SOLUE
MTKRLDQGRGFQVLRDRSLTVAALFFAAVSSSFGQVVLVLPDGAPAPGLYDLGAVDSGQIATARFRLRNTSAGAATVSSLSVAGVGFGVNAPSTPFGIPALDAVDFTINFQATGAGSYSAALRADGIAILLTASVLPSLTYRADGANGLVLLTGLDFGAVVRGTAAQRRVTVRNETSVILNIPAISVQGEGFTLAAGAPFGQILQPQQGGEFNVVFSPLATGAGQGTLVIGGRTFPLSGTGTEPPLPKVSLAIDLQPVASARQGNIVIRFDAPAQTTGMGTATLEFGGSADAAIAFASGGRTATFAIASGDTQAVLGFQTGTSAGTITFSVQLGQSTERQSVAIPAAKPTVTASAGVRSSGAVEVRVTGFDNTRTLGGLVFTFYDGAGKTLASVPDDAAADFARFFAASDLGGVFQLRAIFPVGGDASQISSCDVTLANSAGTTIQRIATFSIL